MKKKELVVKDNALVDASYNLDLVEQRLILLAIIEARETGHGIQPESLLQVHASSYIHQFDVERSSAYEALQNASKSLFHRYVTYHDINPNTGKKRTFHVRWVDKIGYEAQSGLVFLRFSQDVVPLITRLEENFTSYELQQVSKLTSAYAIRLYELLIKWRSIGVTPFFELEAFRLKLGLEPHEHLRMSHFKSRVLDFSIDQINQFTDITVSYTQQKSGRNISGFTFSFKQKREKAKMVKTATPTAPVPLPKVMFQGIEAELFKKIKRLYPSVTPADLQTQADERHQDVVVVMQELLSR